MATKDSNRDTGSHGFGAAIEPWAVLLAIAMAMHLAIADVVYLPTADVASFDAASEGTASSRECTPSAAIDSGSLYD